MGKLNNKIPARRSQTSNRDSKLDLGIYGKDEALIVIEKNAGNNLLPAKDDSIFSNEIIENELNFKEIFELTDDLEINKFLIEKSTELYKLHSKTALELGKIFVDVEEKLSGSNQYDGVYTKWLDKNGFNKMTALRYKRRYRLFEQLETVVGKNILMTLPQKMIDELSLKPEEDIKKYLKLLDEGKNKQELKMVMENKSEVVQIASMVDFDFSKEYKKINDKLKKISFDNLDNKKKETLEKDIQRIEKILEKYV